MWYTNKNEACAAASSSQQVWNAAQEKSESGRVDFLELEQAKQRVEELRTIIEKNNRLYYDQDAPELEDFEYDALTRELKALEAQFPQLVTASSPTQKVGGTASSKLPKVTHAVKMESLLDAFRMMNCATLTAVCAKQAQSRSMWSRSRSMVFPAAWNMRMVSWFVPPPAVMA